LIGATVTVRRAGFIATIVSVAAIVGACTPPKPPSAFEEAYDDDTKPWVEIQTQLPPAPEDATLLGFAVSGATQYHFEIDSRSLTIGTDGVYRYTLVATSPSGARNVSYEGIRCEAHQKKTYAIGRADGTWVRARNAAWTPIEEVNNNRQHAALEKEYFCPDGYAARKVEQIIARMKPRLAPSEASYDRQTTGAER
jgi:hypothetical protein